MVSDFFQQSKLAVNWLRSLRKVRERYEGSPGWLKAPNGQPTALTEAQWLLVRTPEFKAWFGDWEQGRGSRVLDANGEPLVLYHGTRADFEKFRIGLPVNGRELGDGIYFTSDPELAAHYGDRLIPIFCNIRNPFSKIPDRQIIWFSSTDDARAFFVKKQREWEDRAEGYNRFMPEIVEDGQGRIGISHVLSYEREPSGEHDGNRTDSGTYVCYREGQIRSAMSFVDFAPSDAAVLDIAEELLLWEEEVSRIRECCSIPDNHVRMLQRTPVVLSLLGEDTVTGRVASGAGLYASPHCFGRKHPNISPEILMQIPAAMADPIAILDSANADHRKNGDVVMMLDVRDAAGATVIVPLVLRAHGKHGMEIDLAKSIYCKEKNGEARDQWFIGQMEKNARYVNREKLSRWACERLAGKETKKKSGNIGAGPDCPLVVSNSSGNNIYFDSDLVKQKELCFGFYQTDMNHKNPEAGLIRGAIEFNLEGRALISLFKNKADISTVLHEAGHLFLENLNQAARLENSPNWIKQDWMLVSQAINAFADPFEEIPVRSHEIFALMVEAYFMRGKAPHKNLEPVFEDLSIWLKEIYGTYRDTHIPESIPQDITDALDRLLSYTTNQYRQHDPRIFSMMLDAGFSENEAMATSCIMMAHALSISPLYGMTPEEWLDSRLEGIVPSSEEQFAEEVEDLTDIRGIRPCN